MAHCHICRDNTPHQETHNQRASQYQDELVERRCDWCHQVTFRQRVPCEPGPRHRRVA